MKEGDLGTKDRSPVAGGSNRCRRLIGKIVRHQDLFGPVAPISIIGADSEHRNLDASHDILGHGAEEQVFDSASSVGAHDNEIAPELGRGFDDRFRSRNAANEVGLDLDRLILRPCAVKGCLGCRVGGRHQAIDLELLLLRHERVFQNHPDVDEVEFGAEQSRQSMSEFLGAVGGG